MSISQYFPKKFRRKVLFLEYVSLGYDFNETYTKNKAFVLNIPGKDSKI